MSSSPKRHSATFKAKVAPGSGPRRGTIRIPHVEGVSGPPGAAWGRQARGGGSAAGTVEDSVGLRWTPKTGPLGMLN